MYRDFESRQDFDDYDDDVVFDDGGVVTWERYNTETREVEDYIDIEAGDDDRVEAMERLVDVIWVTGSSLQSGGRKAYPSDLSVYFLVSPFPQLFVILLYPGRGKFFMFERIKNSCQRSPADMRK